MPPRSERIVFEGSQGLELAARLDWPSDPPRAFALFAHCFTCSKDVFAAARISRGLAEHGIAVLRFDFTGLGSSEGDFANTNFSSNVGDLVAAADFLRREHSAPAILVGHSLGGAAVLAAAGRIPESLAVATINAPCDPSHVRNLFGDTAADIEADGSAEVVIAGRAFRITKQFLDDLEEQRMRHAIGTLEKALLVFHAPGDAVVGIDDAHLIFEAARHPKNFVALDGADHLLSRHEDAAYAATIVAAWAGRYLPATPVATSGDTLPRTVLVQETGESRFGNEVLVGRHRLTADEPLARGGADSGPTPYDYLLAGLGACTTITLRMYAERKQLPLERVSVRLHHEKIHAEDCANCEQKEGKIDRIQREISLDGTLDFDQRQRLLQIAEKCPVHRTLHSDTWIVSRLADPE